MASLGKTKYTVIVRVFNSKDVSVPHNRPRLWFFAVLSTFLALLGVTPEDLEFAYTMFLNMFLQDLKPHTLDDYLLPEHDPAIVARHGYHLAAWKTPSATVIDQDGVQDTIKVGGPSHCGV